MKKVLFIVLIFGIFFSGCVTDTGKEQVSPTATVSSQTSQYLEIVLKDVGLPEVKYLQPTIKEIQLKDQSGKWMTIWSSSEGKTFKLTPDGAEVVLDRVNVKAGTYIETRMLVTAVGVEVDINRDGDTLDKNVQIILTEEEFASLPQQEKPSGASTPTPPSQPTPPTQPSGPSSEPSEPSQPTPPSQPTQPTQPPQPTPPSEPLPPGVQKIEGGLVYMNEYQDEVWTATPPYFDGIHNDTYFYPALKTDFVYSGSGGKIIYDFTLHPLLPKHEQISVEVSMITTSNSTTVLLDGFNGTTKGVGFGALTYEDSLPNLGKAVNLAKGAYIKYSFSPWYKWDGAHKWDRNEAATGMLTEGSTGMWIKPRQYSEILTFNWNDAASSPQAGYIMHFGFNADGKLTYSVWGGHLDTVLVGKTTIPLNKWTHVAVSWSPNGTKLYLNGEVDAYTSANVWPAFSGTVFAYLNCWGGNDLGLVDDFYISKVAEPPAVVPPGENVTANATVNTMANVTPDVKISSFTCSYNTVAGIEHIRAVAKGTAQGEVGARLELPILIWSDDKFDCGNWTLSKGALIAVGSTCVRKAGQPETTTWTADTGGEEQGSWLKGKSMSYSAKIYMNNNITPEKVDNRTAICQ